MHLLNFAVFRSDLLVPTLVHSGYLGQNSGAGTVLLQGNTMDVNTQAVATVPSTPHTVQVIALDEILERLGHVKLLKLDCEGSEFPILLTSRLLERVERISGEYHQMEPELYTHLDPQAQVAGYESYRMQDLTAFLQARGFQVRVYPHTEYLGLFFARRAPAETATP